MSDTEAIMWAVEKDPALRSDFVNVTILESTPDAGRVRAKIERAIADIPRLTHRVVNAPLRLAPPEWQPDPSFDLDYHVRRVAAPAPGTTREMLDLAAVVASTPLDRSRPLWEFTLVEGMEDGRAALLQKVHHAVTDGVGGLRLSLSLLDFEADAPIPEPAATDPADVDHETTEARRATPTTVVGDALRYSLARQAELARRGVEAALHLVIQPQHAPERAAEVRALAASIRRQVVVTEPAHSPLLRTRSLSRRFEIFQVPLEPTRATAKALGGTVNDVFVTAVAGALGAYHDRMGVECDDLRMAMAVNLRADDDDEAANAFAPTRILVPIQPKDPVVRFTRTMERLADIRGEPALGVTGTLAQLVAPLPTSMLVAMTHSQARTIDFATSNLRGSPVDLYLGGARIIGSFPMGPRTGCALNVTLLSYKDSLDLGLNLDPAAITDPEAFLECLGDSFGALLELGRPRPKRRTPAKATKPANTTKKASGGASTTRRPPPATR